MSLQGSSGSYTLNVDVNAQISGFFGITLDVVGDAQINTDGTFAMLVGIQRQHGAISRRFRHQW